LAKVNDDTFASLVADDVKNKILPEQREILMNQDNWDRWKRALLSLVENLNEQIEEINNHCALDTARFKALGRDGKKLIEESERVYKQRRLKIERFKHHVDRRLDQVMKMIETGELINANPWDMVDFYRRAISTHRSFMNKFDLEATAIDTALWESLDSKWKFDSITADNLQ